MIIDTNGFEIGDEVWYIDYSYSSFGIVDCFKITSFGISEKHIYALGGSSLFLYIQSLYHTEQECQLACDKLNGKSEN